MDKFFRKITTSIINMGLNFISIDDKIVRMILGTSSKNVRPIVLFPATSMTLKKLLKKSKNIIQKGIIYNCKINSVDVSIIQTNIGSPNTTNILEALIRTECKIIIRIDFCGALMQRFSNLSIKNYKKGNITDLKFENTGINVGDLVIPEECFLSDGASLLYFQHYYDKLKNSELIYKYPKINELRLNKTFNLMQYPSLNENYYAAICKEEILSIFSNKLKKDNIFKPKKIRIWSTDSLFCENESARNTWRFYNCDFVDMETCSLYLFSALFNLYTLSILSVSDLPDSNEYNLLETNKIHPDLLKGLDDAIDLLINKLPDVQKLYNVINRNKEQ